jgi:ApbE superfamily uncharacterized protein (UPF0280 family)
MANLRHFFRMKETIVTILADGAFFPAAEAEIVVQRKRLEAYIRLDPLFASALVPYRVPDSAPEIVRRMAAASARVGVGPMASVAGAVAEYALGAMLRAGAHHAVVDNGGDIAMFIDRPLVVGLYAGPSRVRNLGLRFEPRGRVLGVCTSSATVGPSLSFGRADAAVAVSEDVLLADATATSVGNALRLESPESIGDALERHMLPGIEGLMAVVGNQVGMCGELPEIVRAKVDNELITKG